MLLTHIKINNFKKIESIEFDLTESVVLIGPNNSGKTSIFQALSLWEIGVKKVLEKVQAPLIGGIVINRKDLVNSPIADARDIWPQRQVTRGESPMHFQLGGHFDGKPWVSRIVFTYVNAESIEVEVKTGLPVLRQIFADGLGVRFSFLQPMSGIAFIEDKLTPGGINRRMGEGRTAEVLRNICYDVRYPEFDGLSHNSAAEDWNKITLEMARLFGAHLQEPEFIKTTGSIRLEYIERGITFDISAAGRGLQQTLLLLAFMYAKKGTVMLLDEPDAHLEVIRQRAVFQLLNRVAASTKSQLIIASHSEVMLDEAAEASKVVALVENRALELNKHDSQSIRYIRRALTEIGWEKYYLARLKGHILYLEGSTDLQMLLAFAKRLDHKVTQPLELANVDYTGNDKPSTAAKTFVPISQFFPEVRGLALFDRLPPTVQTYPFTVISWRKRELENYFSNFFTLMRFATAFGTAHPGLMPLHEVEETMRKAISDNTTPARLANPDDPWWNYAKLSEEWLPEIFEAFYRAMGVPIDFYKRDYYQLISHMNPERVDPEVTEKLDLIYEFLKPTASA